MSLINKMLQDLDKRSSERAAGHAMAGQVRAVPARARQITGWMIAVPMLLLLVSGAAGLWLKGEKGQASPGEAVTQKPGKTEALPLPVTAMPRPALKLSPSLSMWQSLSNDSVIDAGLAEKVRKEDLPVSKVNATLNFEATETGVISAEQKRIKDSRDSKIPGNRDFAQIPVVLGIQGSATRFSDADAPASPGKQVKEPAARQRPDSEYRKAITLLQQAKVPEAMAVLEQTLLVDPNHAAARQTLVGLLLEAKRMEDALRLLHDGLNLDPAQIPMAMILARLQVEKTELHKAVLTLQRSLPYAAEREDFLAFFAALLQREGRHKEAADYYAVALRKAPQNAVWWMGMGISLQAENRIQQAEEAFAQAKGSKMLSPELQAFVEQRLKQLQH